MVTEVNAVVHSLVPAGVLLALVGVLAVSGGRVLVRRGAVIAAQRKESSVAMRKRRSTKKVRLSDTERLDRALHIDWIVSEEIVFRVTHCRQCGAAPGPLHVPAHAAWLEDVRALEAMLQIPSKEVN